MEFTEKRKGQAKKGDVIATLDGRTGVALEDMSNQQIGPKGPIPGWGMMYGCHVSFDGDIEFVHYMKVHSFWKPEAEGQF